MEVIVLALTVLGMAILRRLYRRPTMAASDDPISEEREEGLNKLLERMYATEPLGTVDCTPDFPTPFGCKTSWLAVEAPRNPERLLQFLPITDTQNANWATGMKAVSKNYVFVSPPIDGWMFVLSHHLPAVVGPDEVDMLTPLLQSLSKEFGCAQFFCSDRRVNYYGWARFEDNKEVRSFGSLAGEFVANRGELTESEIDLGLDYCDPDDPDEVWDATDASGPREDDVNQLARMWSFDPLTLSDRKYPVSVGWIATLRESARLYL